MNKTEIRCANCGSLLAILYELESGTFYESMRGGHTVTFDHGFVVCHLCFDKTYLEPVEDNGLIKKLAEA